MSWNFSCAGSKAAVKKALAKQLASYGAPAPANHSQAEFAAAAPLIEGIVDQNTASPDYQYGGQIIEVSASGSGSREGDKLIYQSCNVSVKAIHTAAE